MSRDDLIITTSTNQALLRPNLQTGGKKGKSRTRTPSVGSPRKKSKGDASKPLLHRNDSSSSSSMSKRSGLVDLVVEDKAAEETERVRARKEGGPGWNDVEPRRYVRQYPPEVAGEEIREGFEPLAAPPAEAPSSLHATQGEPAGSQFTIGDDSEGNSKDDLSNGGVESYHDDSPWDRDDEERATGGNPIGIYGSLNERDVWGR
jgi:hypothetical protein